MQEWKGDIRSAQQGLEGRFDIVPVEDLNCPVFLAMAVPKDMHVSGRKPRFPSGRGLSRIAATESAVGETVELLASLAQNVDQGRHSITIQDGFAHVAALDLATGLSNSVPAQSVFLDWAAVCGEPLVTDAGSNGCAAGLTSNGAVQRALLEVIERDALATWWFGRQRRPHLPVAIIDDFEPRLSWWLADRDRVTMLIDLSMSSGAFVVAAVSSDPLGRNIAIGSAAEAVLHDAAINAITEMVQTEVAMKMASAEPGPELSTWLIEASMAMPQFVPAKGGDVLAMPRTTPLQSVIAEGYRVLAVDLTRKEDALAAVRVLVPGLSDMRGSRNETRILEFAARNPEFGGVGDADLFERLEPY